MSNAFPASAKTGAAREMLAVDILAGQLSATHAFEICDETGKMLEIVHFISPIGSTDLTDLSHR